MVSQNYGYHFRGPNNQDYSIWVSILGSPYLGKKKHECVCVRKLGSSKAISRVAHLQYGLLQMNRRITGAAFIHLNQAVPFWMKRHSGTTPILIKYWAQHTSLLSARKTFNSTLKLIRPAEAYLHFQPGQAI